MAKLLGQKFGIGAGLASASFIAGSTVAYCESDKGRPLFDPEALERGAKALKEINASPYAKKVRIIPQHPHHELDVLHSVPFMISLYYIMQPCLFLRCCTLNCKY